MGTVIETDRIKAYNAEKKRLYQKLANSAHSYRPLPFRIHSFHAVNIYNLFFLSVYILDVSIVRSKINFIQFEIAQSKVLIATFEYNANLKMAKMNCVKANQLMKLQSFFLFGGTDFGRTIAIKSRSACILNEFSCHSCVSIKFHDNNELCTNYTFLRKSFERKKNLFTHFSFFFFFIVVKECTYVTCVSVTH